MELPQHRRHVPRHHPCFSERIQSLSERRNNFPSKLEFEIESSKSHWMEKSVATLNCDSDEEPVPNIVVFEKLEHLQWGPFLRKWPYKLEIGEKVAEGGQAEIFAATVTNETDCCRDGSSKPKLRWHWKGDLVVKVFHEDFPLQGLQQMWPCGFASAELLNQHFYKIPPKHSPLNYGLCWVQGAAWLEDGRFAFIFQKYLGDLRKRINGIMRKSNGTPPFSWQMTLRIMWNIAQGMATLHRFGLLHRDLKATNVLVVHYGVFSAAFIANFESSIGVVGTGFWRAPEVLLALKNGGSIAVKFSQQSDVYSFAMTCYKVITGCLPFEGHPLYDFDVVLRGDRPALPDEILSEWKAFVRKCWHQDPLQQPSFQEIVEDLTAMAD